MTGTRSGEEKEMMYKIAASCECNARCFVLSVGIPPRQSDKAAPDPPPANCSSPTAPLCILHDFLAVADAR